MQNEKFLSSFDLHTPRMGLCVCVRLKIIFSGLSICLHSTPSNFGLHFSLTWTQSESVESFLKANKKKSRGFAFFPLQQKKKAHKLFLNEKLFLSDEELA